MAYRSFRDFIEALDRAGELQRVNVPVEQQTLEQWQTILDINLTSAFLIAYLLARRGDRRSSYFYSITSIVLF